MEPVTIAIPTYNRAPLLKESLESALAQDYPHLTVLVLDNASTDNTREVVHSFADKRVVYVGSDTNLGMVSNWNRAIELNTHPFLVVLQDDDRLLPGFVRESLSELEKHPQAAFSFARIRHVDADGNPGSLKDPYPGADGVADGLANLHRVVSGQGWFLHSSAVLLRASMLTDIAGRFDSPHARHAFDFNLFVRLAARFSVVPVLKELVHVRVHAGQDTDAHWRSGTATGPLGFVSERMDALAYLLQSERAQDPAYRQWLAQRLLTLNAQRSAYTHPLLPQMYWDWNERWQMALRDIAGLVPPGESFVLVDEDQWATGGEVAGRKALAFPAKEGLYWGPPPDDESAIAQLESLRQSGVQWVVFGWPAFWWLEHYTGLLDYLGAAGEPVFSSAHLVAFRLKTG